ncbi:MAG: hypothetical protein LBT14_07190 [Treponema sp.]|jgi:septal ring factor EnvC (AmiA/AmiB activator)|nr:hypothetical protein [Treponema sp.]
MNVKNSIAVVIRYFVVFVLGCLLTGVCAHIRELEQTGKYHERVANIQREYDQRQRELENGLGESQRIIGDARAIAGRTTDSLGRSAKNISEASALIRDLYFQIQEIENILNRGIAGCSGDRNTDGGVNWQPLK